MDSVVKKTTKQYPKLQNLKENRHLVIEAIQKYETEESRAVLNQYIGVLTMQAKDKAVVAEARETLKNYTRLPLMPVQQNWLPYGIMFYETAVNLCWQSRKNLI